MAASAQGKKIGLLGGSFNPAHEGHVYISEKALELLGLDEIWWLVSPQNPLKETEGMASFEKRFATAQKIAAGNPKIHVSDFEKKSGTNYTFDTLTALNTMYKQHNFVWIMGADNLVQFPKWHKWREILGATPIAIFNREGFKDKALTGEVVTEFSAYKIENLAKLATSIPPAWAFMDIETPKISATQIRAKEKR